MILLYSNIPDTSLHQHSPCVKRPCINLLLPFPPGQHSMEKQCVHLKKNISCFFLLLFFFFFNLCVSVWIFYWPGFQFSVSVFCCVEPVVITIKWVIHVSMFFISRKAIEFLKNRSQIAIENFHIFFHGSYFSIFPLTN